MIRAFFRHSVKDYSAWRQIYDGFGPTQRQFGVIDSAVYRNVEDPNNVTITHDFQTLEAAKTFVSSDELKEAMVDAGVTSAPDMWFTEPA